MVIFNFRLKEKYDFIIALNRFVTIALIYNTCLNL